MFFKGLLFFCFYLPFQLALNPSADVDLASGRLLAISLFLGWLLVCLKNKKVIVPNKLVSLGIISFLVLAFCSVVEAKNGGWSTRKLLFLFSFFPLYFVSSALIDKEEKLERIVKTLVSSGFFISLLAIFQFFSQFVFGLDRAYRFWAKTISPIFLGRNVTEAVLKNPSWLVNIAGNTYWRAVATFPDPHMLAFFLGMLIPLALGIYLKNRKTVYALMLFSMLLADFLTFSRGGYLGLFLGLLLGFIFWLKERKKQLRLILGVVFLVGMGMLFVSGPISTRFFSSFNFQEGSNKGRLETWKKAGKIIEKHPLGGVGIGNYALEIDPMANYRDPIYAHSLYLDIAAETGIVNLGAWLGIIGALILDFWRKARKNSLFFGAMLSLVIFSAHALVETPLYSPIILPLFLIIASFNSLEIFDEKNS